MRVRITQSIATDLRVYTPGQEIETTNEHALELLQAGAAEVPEMVPEKATKPTQGEKHAVRTGPVRPLKQESRA